MGRRDSYEPGVPCWADVSVDDLEGARAFYGALFGWDPDISDVPDAGGYTNFRLDGLTVAGAGPKMGGPVPDAWSVAVATDDVERSLAVAADAGGEVVAGPAEIPTKGTFGMVADPNGAFIGLWKGAGHIGAQIVNDPNTFVWNELATPDLAASVAFYGALFGWQLQEHDGGGIFTDASGTTLCGVHPAGARRPPGGGRGVAGPASGAGGGPPGGLGLPGVLHLRVRGRRLRRVGREGGRPRGPGVHAARGHELRAGRRGGRSGRGGLRCGRHDRGRRLTRAPAGRSPAAGRSSRVGRLV